jgi:hypothetical protein
VVDWIYVGTWLVVFCTWVTMIWTWKTQRQIERTQRRTDRHLAEIVRMQREREALVTSRVSYPVVTGSVYLTDEDAYEPDDPKHPTYHERWAEGDSR